MHPLLGTWKLKSYVVTAGAGDTSMPYGAHPTGYLSYSADGRMQAIGTSSERIAPGEAPTDADQAGLYQTMFAYAGTWSVEAGKVTHHVDVSWNEAWTGTDQVRAYDIEGDMLTITTRVVDPANGAESVYVVTWEKLAGPR